MTSTVIPREIGDALDHHGLRARRCTIISPPDASKRDRSAYRIDLVNGRKIKVRLLESREAARHLFELRAGLESTFVPAIGQHRQVILEAWIDGAPLSEEDACARAEECGAILGRLHSTNVASAPPTVTLDELRRLAMEELEVLGGEGSLPPREVARLHNELRAHEPEAAEPVLLHRDFCPENMRIDVHGRLYVIDNEWLAIGPAGFDLGRTYVRWPMPADVWDRFLESYRSSARVEIGELSFWKIVVALWTVRRRSRRGGARLMTAVRQLRRLARSLVAAVPA